MAHIFRQIDSTKSLRAELDRRNISMFNSIREIEEFKRNYKSISEDILAQAHINLRKEISQKSSKLESLEADLIAHIKSHERVLKKQILSLDSKVSDLNERIKNAPFLEGLFYSIYRRHKKSKLHQLTRNRDKIISNRTASRVYEVESLQADINRLNQNADEIAFLDCKNELQELERTKKAVSELRTIIAGARGEYAVEQELKNLPNNFYVINDYRLNLNRPIINKQTGEKIYSIQIDHLVISPGGVFLLETKNWSQRSINSLELRSPIEQIQRSSYALFVFINKNISMNSHHWGSKQISLKSVLVMTGAMTNQKFKFITVKQLNQINKYLTYFDAIFNDREVEWLANTLLDYCDD